MMTRQQTVLALVLASILILAGCGSKTSKLETGGIDANDVLTNLLDKTTRILGDVTNVDSAEVALPQLEKINEGYDDLIKESDNLSPGARQDLADQAAAAMPGLKENARRMNAKKGVDEILGPVMNEMVGKLAKLL
jgi:hypothetical protein